MNAKTTELLSKISLKGIGAQPKRGEIKEGDKPKDVAILFGRANRYEVGQTTYGEFTKFRGAFEATNLSDGAVFKAGAILVPRIVEDMIREAIDGANGASVDFALVVGVKYAENAVGYEWTVRPVVELKESDELSALRNVALAALPAPAKSEATSQAKDEAPAKGARAKA